MSPWEGYGDRLIDPLVWPNGDVMNIVFIETASVWVYCSNSKILVRNLPN